MKRTMTRKIIIITVACTLIVSFFMPWVKIPSSISAWDFISGATDDLIYFPFKYIGVIIPAAALIIVCGTIFNLMNHLVARTLLFPLPLITIIVIIIITAFKFTDIGIQIRGPYLAGIIKITGVGFWFTLTGAILLPGMLRLNIKNRSVK